MADELEVLPPENDEDEGGGPVKTFLEHLEDLRWTLLKCAIAIALGIVAALSASPSIVKFLMYPLVLAQRMKTTTDTRVILMLGTNVLARMPATNFPIAGGPTNRDLVLRLAPVTVGTNQLLALLPDPNAPESARYGMNVDLKTLGPAEAFSVAIQIGLYGGFAISAPFVLLFLAQFMLPALHMHEKRFVYRAAGFGTLLFFSGVTFCYFIMLVITLSTTVSFSNWLGFTADVWRATEYISFTCWFMLGMGLAFELPLVLLTLVKIGILNAEQLGKFRMYWVVAGLTLAAFITPDGNPFTMLLMFLPLHVLYEVSVLIAKWWERQEARAQTVEEARR